MNNKYLGRIILSGTVVLATLIVLQVYWFSKAFDVAEKQFDHSVSVALKKVADSISHDAEVKKLSSNFFFVDSHSKLNDHTLNGLLSKEFLVRGLHIDYELGVYNADEDTLVYGNYVKATQPVGLADEGHASLNNRQLKNFAVYFPRKDGFVVASLNIWIISTGVLVLMIGFFAYAIYTLLRERKFSALKSDFVNNMTHEFRTPVTNIGIAGEILRTKLREQDGLNVYVDILLKENDKLRNKIDKVLLGSSTDHFKSPLLAPLDVHQVIADSAEAFKLKIQERQGSLELEFNAANSAIVGDRDLLTQAISNVIDNAEKYSPQNPKIIVRTHDRKDGVGIEVVDNGIGISEEMSAKVFDKFFRVRSGNVHNVKGFGLGLSFVKQVVRTHRGKVSLLSEINRGTAVRIFLPKG